MPPESSAAAKPAVSPTIAEERADYIETARQLRRHALRPSRENELLKRLTTLRLDAREAAQKRVAPHPKKEVWSPERIALVQQIWGAGFTAPGGAEGILDIVEPLNLQRRMRVLELGAGLGGAGRVLARRRGVHVTGIECDRRLAKAGMALSIKAWLARRAPVRYLGGPGMDTPLGSFDCFLARNFLFSGAQRAWMLRLIGAVLNHHGQLLITDFVLPKSGRCSSAIQEWLATEPGIAIPWATADYANGLTAKGLEVRIDDITDATCEMIRRSWADYLTWLRALGKERRPTKLLVEETERWARRVRLLETGELTVCRIHAAKRLLDRPPMP